MHYSSTAGSHRRSSPSRRVQCECSSPSRSRSHSPTVRQDCGLAEGGEAEAEGGGGLAIHEVRKIFGGCATRHSNSRCQPRCFV